MYENLAIVLVDDDHANQKTMSKILEDLFPKCQIKILGTGEEARDYLLSPSNNYDLVILDGNLKSSPAFSTPMHGPDVANAMKNKGIKVPVVLWTNDPYMLARFDEVYGKRIAEIEKPCRAYNVEVILKPIVKSIMTHPKSAEQDNP